MLNVKVDIVVQHDQNQRVLVSLSVQQELMWQYEVSDVCHVDHELLVKIIL